jgi:hypothetical protein
MRSTPERSSVAASAIVGLLVNQPPQAPPAQVIELVGAVESATTVKLVGADTRPAVFVAVTLLAPVGVTAVAVKV